MKTTSIIAFILAIVGALNWLLVGLFRFNLVGWALSFLPMLSNVVYILVGLAGLWLIFFIFFYKPFKRVS